MINSYAELCTVAPADPAQRWCAEFYQRVFPIVVQSTAIHPDWTSDDHAAYLVNDAALPPADLAALAEHHPGGRLPDMIAAARRQATLLVAHAHRDRPVR